MSRIRRSFYVLHFTCLLNYEMKRQLNLVPDYGLFSTYVTHAVDILPVQTSKIGKWRETRQKAAL